MASWEESGRRFWRWVGVLVAAAVAVGVIVEMFGPLTDLIARHDVGAVAGPHRAAALQSARDAARGRMLQLGAGLFAAGALIYTARNFTLSREGQVTDRYTKAIDQIGDLDKIDVRIGGIYALERVARDSRRDHWTIMEVLAAFVREHSHEPWPTSVGAEPGGGPLDPKTRPDVQAALTVIGHRNPRHDQWRKINLTGVSLSGADLIGTNLSGMFLFDANVSGARLAFANLRDAHLGRANLTHADLALADLRGADLTHANLTGASLRGADITDARISGAVWPEDHEVPEGWRRDDSGRMEWAASDPGGEATE